MFSLLVVIFMPVSAIAVDTKDLRSLNIKLKKHTEDFDGMQRRRAIRLLVPYSKTLFYEDSFVTKGTAAVVAREFELFINKKLGTKGALPFTVVLIPTSRDKLLAGLLQGEGDIALGNITITSARSKIVDFSIPIGKPFSQIVVTSKDIKLINELDDLSGIDVYVRKSTSYYESLLDLNRKFKKQKKKPARLIYLSEDLEDEDKMSMVNSSLLSVIIVDEWITSLWAPVYKEMRVYSNIKIKQADQVGWAFRKNSPILASVINEFIRDKVNKTGLYNIAIRQSEGEIRKLGNIRDERELQKFKNVEKIFAKYGAMYGFDHLMLMAQGYQESRLDHSVKSPAGAVGIMQILPSTGSAMQVGDIHKLEPNIHAAIKYMDHIILQYLGNSSIDDLNRILFAFASYNAGPSRIAKLRKHTAEAGLDSAIWFNNVEHIAAREIGQETVRYVRNIFKYFVAYKLLLESEMNRAKALEKAR